MILFSKGMVNQQDELQQLTEKTRKMLNLIAYYVEKTYGQYIVITSAIRTKEEQMAIAKKIGKPYTPSTHEYGRAVDFRVFKEEKINEDLLNWVNARWPYDLQRPHLKTLLRHKGTADHFHLQSPV